MGLAARRVGLIALGLAAVLVPLLRTAQPIEVQGESSARLARLRARARSANTIAAAMEVRESTLPLLDSLPPASAPIEIRYLGFPEGIGSPRVASLLATLSARVGPGDSATRIGVLVYRGEGHDPWVELWGYAGALLRTEPAPRCLAIVPGRIGLTGVLHVGEVTLKRAIGPCLLLARFGAPGSTMRAWLTAARWRPAVSIAWLTGARIFSDGSRSLPWSSVLVEDDIFRDELFRPAWVSRGSRALDRLGLSDVLLFRRPRYSMGAPGIRCLTGDRAACEATVVDTALTARLGRAFPPDLTGAYWRVGSAGLHEARPHPEWWISDLIREFGPERFTRFWKSDAPPDRAFEAAFGEPLGDYQYRWADEKWRNSYEVIERGARITLGAHLPAGNPLAVLFWSAIAVALVAWRAGRRTIV
ncbi:MAG: hypothetical protein ACRENB_00110 [Gemmatimonadales bacterium]